jgi:hypothetical protein
MYFYKINYCICILQIVLLNTCFLCCPLVSPIAGFPTSGSVVSCQGGRGMGYGHSGHRGGRGVASRLGEGSTVCNLNCSDDDSDNDDLDYEDTGVDGDVNRNDSDDFDIINERSVSADA